MVREEGAAAPAPQKTVLVGVTGCIAAYKSCEIVRLLQKAGVRAKVVMTEHATEFVGPTTFRALTREPVAVGLFDDPSDPIHHVSLAQEADCFVIAPCTANVVAKIANGLADDLLTTTALACTCPLVVAPAMNVHMYENPATRYNLGKLHIRGARIVEAGDGYLACGDVGRGRLAEPADIVAAVLEELDMRSDLAGRRVMVTAGPTVEPIDPVRYLTNRSSGKTGYALARAAADRGADVTLVSGPVALPEPEGVRTVHVETAREMLSAAQGAFAAADIAVFSAAVADMRPREAAARKLKKGEADALLGTIELVENPDIPARWWWASPPRPTTWWPMPSGSSLPSMPILSWETRWEGAAPSAPTTTRCGSSQRRRRTAFPSCPRTVWPTASSTWPPRSCRKAGPGLRRPNVGAKTPSAREGRRGFRIETGGPAPGSSKFGELDGVHHRSLALAVVADGNGELHVGVLLEGLEPVGLDLAEVHEQVIAAVLGDETVALVGVEPLNCTCRHENLAFCPAGHLTGSAGRARTTANNVRQRAASTSVRASACFSVGVGRKAPCTRYPHDRTVGGRRTPEHA